MMCGSRKGIMLTQALRQISKWAERDQRSSPSPVCSITRLRIIGSIYRTNNQSSKIRIGIQYYYDNRYYYTITKPAGWHVTRQSHSTCQVDQWFCISVFNLLAQRCYISHASLDWNIRVFRAKLNSLAVLTTFSNVTKCCDKRQFCIPMSLIVDAKQ